MIRLSKVWYRLFIMACCIFLSGCATLGSQLAFEKKDKAKYSFDFSKGDENGKIVITCLSQPGQSMIVYYVIRINNAVPLQVEKDSEVEIILNVGEHDLEVYSTPEMETIFYDEHFGKKTVKKIIVNKDEIMHYKYIGPFHAFEEGVLRVVEQKSEKQDL